LVLKEAKKGWGRRVRQFGNPLAENDGNSKERGGKARSGKERPIEIATTGTNKIRISWGWGGDSSIVAQRKCELREKGSDPVSAPELIFATRKMGLERKHRDLAAIRLQAPLHINQLPKRVR